MTRNLRRCALGLAVTVGASFGSALPAAAFSYANGDFVVAIVKNGAEVILNLGQTGSSGKTIDPSALTNLPTAFGGNIGGALVTGFSVLNPTQTFNIPGFPGNGTPQANIVSTSLTDLNALFGNGSATTLANYNSIANSQAQLRSTGGSTDSWLLKLTTVGAANGTDVLFNSSNQLSILSSLFASYTGSLGFGTNVIANTAPFDTSGTLPLDISTGFSIPIFGLLQDRPAADNFARHVDVSGLGSLVFVPEPGTVLLLVAGLGGLALYGRRRD